MNPLGDHSIEVASEPSYFHAKKYTYMDTFVSHNLISEIDTLYFW